MAEKPETVTIRGGTLRVLPKFCCGELCPTGFINQDDARTTAEAPDTGWNVFPSAPLGNRFYVGRPVAG